MRSRRWRNSLWVQRRDLAKLLRRNPSLRGHVDEALADEYPAAVAGALDETGLPDGAFPTAYPYLADQLQDYDFLPD
jgi:hypothetical protein